MIRIKKDLRGKIFILICLLSFLFYGLSSIQVYSDTVEQLAQSMNKSLKIKKDYELKDITNKQLYRNKDGKYEVVSSVTLDEIQKEMDKYFLKVDMEYQPTVFAPLNDAEISNGKLLVTLDLPEYVQYTEGLKTTKIQQSLGEVEKNIISITTAEDFIEKVRQNPSGHFTLKQDIDFSTITTINSPVFGPEFTGTFDGNNHVIKNVTKPLFGVVKSGTIKNLYVENAAITAGQNEAIVANQLQDNAQAENIHVRNSTVTATNKKNQVGGLFALIQKKSVVNNVSAQNVSISVPGNSKTVGLLVGWIDGSTITDAYVQGSIQSTNGDRLGGVAGVAYNSIFDKILVDAKINHSESEGAQIGSVVGYSYKNNGKNKPLTLKHLINLNKEINMLDGSGKESNDEKNIQKDNTVFDTSSEGGKGTTIDKSFYQNQLKLDTKVWDLDNIENQMVRLRAMGTFDSDEKDVLTTEDNQEIHLPNLERLKSVEGFKQENAIAYYNAYQLMPHYDANVLIDMGNKIASIGSWNTQQIKGILPIGSDGSVVDAMSLDNRGLVKKIKVMFENNDIGMSSLDLNVIPRESDIFIDNYYITELGIDYNYKKYLVNTDSETFKKVLNKTNELSYEQIVSRLNIAGNDSRIYSTFYNDQTKASLKEALIKLLGNIEALNIYGSNETVNNYVLTELETNNKLEELLWTYNYFTRWYDFEIGGIKAYSITYFDGSIFNNDINPSKLSVSLTSTNWKTSNTNGLFKALLKNLIGRETVSSYIEYLLELFAENKYKENPQMWFSDYYTSRKNYIYEVGLNTGTDADKKVIYRAWDKLKINNNNFIGLILPLLTSPESSGYIVSVPTQFFIGATRTWLLEEEIGTERDNMMELMRKLGDTWQKHYSTFYDTLKEGNAALELNKTAIDVYNNTQNISIDQPFLKERVNGKRPYLQASKTDEKWHANVKWAMGWETPNWGSSAYANGWAIMWQQYGALGMSDVQLQYTGSHEMTHNQDNAVYLFGLGRRGHGEDYADGGFTQSPGNGYILNFRRDFDVTSNISTNLTTERINTSEKLDDFLAKMWETLDYLDYIEMQAFFELSKEQQEVLAVRAIPGGDRNNDTGAGTTLFESVSASNEKLKDKLTTWDQLWDQKIIISNKYGGRITTAPRAYYGEDNIYTRNWYTVHNDNGIPDTWSFGKLAWEMGGSYGYAKGLVQYFSGKYANDLAALRAITGDETITYKEWKKSKFDTVEKKKDNMYLYDFDTLKKYFLEALKKDAQAGYGQVYYATQLREAIYQNLKKSTDDFRSSIYNEEKSTKKYDVSSVDQFISIVTAHPNAYLKLTKNIDFSSYKGIGDIVFYGTLDGDNKTIQNLSVPLFENMKFAHVKNLNVNSAKIQLGSKEYVASISGKATSSVIENVNIFNSVFSGSKFVGAVVGFGENVVYSNEISVKDVDIQGTQYTGGLFGAYNNSCLVSSSIENSIDNSVEGSQHVGGITGYAQNSLIDKTYANTSVKSSSGVYTGGFVGQVTTAKINNKIVNHSSITNSLSVGNVINGYKFDGGSDASVFTSNLFKNNYEYSQSLGKPAKARSEIKETDIKSIDKIEKSFFSQFSNLSFNIYSDITHISSIEELKKITSNPYGHYILDKDIVIKESDSSNLNYLVADFKGKLDGAGHRITGLDTALFNHVEGATIENLIIDNANNQKKVRNKGILTNTSLQSYFDNIIFETPTISVNDWVVGTVSGLDKKSIFTDIFIYELNVMENSSKGNGYVGSFVGRAYSSVIQNVYVQGNMVISGTDSGGFIGSLEKGSNLNKVIVDVNVERRASSEARLNNTAFIGNINNANTISNAVILGSIFNVSSNTRLYKTIDKTKTSENDINKMLKNVYELQSETNDLNASNEVTNGHIDIFEYSKYKFLLDELGFTPEFITKVKIDDDRFDVTSPEVKIEYKVTEDSQGVVANINTDEEVTINGSRDNNSIELTEEAQVISVKDNVGNETKEIVKAISWISESSKNIRIGNPNPGNGMKVKKPVTVVLILSDGFEVTNNGGEKVHTFNENGKFIFEVKNKDTNEISFVAIKVDWISD